MNFFRHTKNAFLVNSTKIQISALTSISLTEPNTNKQRVCNKAVTDAEKIVGYPTSFLSLRWILNDEIANIAMHIRKLIGTNHPLLETARKLLLRQEMPAWGLIVLLISKAGGVNKPVLDIDCDITAGILHKQRVLAEVTEMIRISNIIHKSLVTIEKNVEEGSDLHYGNKIALLCGDYLLSTSFRELAGLKNHDVNELISTTLRDLAEGEFIEPRDKQNQPLPAKPLAIQNDVTIPNEFGATPFAIEHALGNTKAEWTLRHLLGGCSLLAKCCQGTLMLAGHELSLQKQGYLFGRNMALAWQAFLDQESFQPGKFGPFSLISAPVMFHLQHDPGIYTEIMKGSENVENIDYNVIRKSVLSGPGLAKTIELQEEYSELALNALQHFPESDARNGLANIITSM